MSPVCLPLSPNDPGNNLGPGNKFTVTGWGRVTNDNSEAQKVSTVDTQFKDLSV